MTAYEKHQNGIKACKSSLELESYCERMAFDDGITHSEYCDLYSQALTRYQILIDIETTAQSIAGEYNNMKDEEK